MSTDFDADSSSRFSFRVRTNRQTNRQTRLNALPALPAWVMFETNALPPAPLHNYCLRKLIDYNLRVDVSNCRLWWCSAGVGRTGVFVTLSIVLERMRYEGVVDMFQTVKMLFTQRPAMVQTEVSTASSPSSLSSSSSFNHSFNIFVYYWPAEWASIVLLAGVCRRLSSSVTRSACGTAGAGRMGTRRGNTAGGRAGRPASAWTVGAPSAGRVGGRAADTARRASRVTSRYGDTLLILDRTQVNNCNTWIKNDWQNASYSRLKAKWK